MIAVCFFNIKIYYAQLRKIFENERDRTFRTLSMKFY